MSRLWLSVAAAAALSSVSVLAYAAAPAYVDAALADPGRIQADRDTDPLRKPADMIEFAGIKPGSKVVDISPGGPAYFTRIFSKVVGPTGKVYGVNNPPRTGAGAPGAGRGPGGAPGGAPAAAAPTPPPAERAPMSAYTNVEMLNAPVSIAQGFTVPEPVDVVWTSRNYHDFKNASADLAGFNKAAFDALKPGGIFIVLDHAAAESATGNVTSDLHRIKESVVKAEVQAVGFKLVGSSNALRNPADNGTGLVRETDIRGKTDQFILKFQKP